MATLPLAEFLGIGWLEWYQPLLLVLMVVLIVFWMQYRRKQM